MRPMLRNIAFDGIDLDRVFNDSDDTTEVIHPPQLMYMPSNLSKCVLWCAGNANLQIPE